MGGAIIFSSGNVRLTLSEGGGKAQIIVAKEDDTTEMEKLLLLELGKFLSLAKKIHQNVGTQCPQLPSGFPTHYLSNLEDSTLSESMP